jgi:flagellar hook assembly protein FlgD
LINDVSGNTNYQNLNVYPNPFNSQAKITFSINEPCDAILNIYNLTGEHIRTIPYGFADAGNYLIHWDAKDNSGTQVPAGVYRIALSYGIKKQSVMVLLIN